MTATEIKERQREFYGSLAISEAAERFEKVRAGLLEGIINQINASLPIGSKV